jgi:hypothetical protein
MQKYFCCLVLLTILTGCSNKDLYQAGQDYQKSECINKARTDVEHNECLKSEGKSYREYEKERKAIINK